MILNLNFWAIVGLEKGHKPIQGFKDHFLTIDLSWFFYVGPFKDPFGAVLNYFEAGLQISFTEEQL